jgi:hypothetical protein
MMAAFKGLRTVRQEDFSIRQNELYSDEQQYSFLMGEVRVM